MLAVPLDRPTQMSTLHFDVSAMNGFTTISETSSIILLHAYLLLLLLLCFILILLQQQAKRRKEGMDRIVTTLPLKINWIDLSMERRLTLLHTFEEFILITVIFSRWEKLMLSFLLLMQVSLLLLFFLASFLAIATKRSEQFNVDQ